MADGARNGPTFKKFMDSVGGAALARYSANNGGKGGAQKKNKGGQRPKSARLGERERLLEDVDRLRLATAPRVRLAREGERGGVERARAERSRITSVSGSDSQKKSTGSQLTAAKND